MNRAEVVGIVQKTLEKIVEGLEMSDDKMDITLTELGVDSLDIMLVMMDISEATGVPISDEQADELDTPEKIVDFSVQE